MTRKRKEQEEQQERAAEEEDGRISADRARRNRDKSRAIAQKRAAFYAHYDPNSPQAARAPRRRNVPRNGGEEEEEQGVQIERKSKEPPPKVAVDWLPAENSAGRHFSAAARPVTSLFQLCCDVLCEHIDHVVSLDGMPDATKDAMLSRLHRINSITPRAVELLFAGSAPRIIRLPDCSRIADREFKQILDQLSLDNLEVLELGFCGRAFSDACLLGIELPTLRKLRLQGGHLLTEAGMLPFLMSTRALKVLELVECCSITTDTLYALPASHLCKLSLQGCSQLNVQRLVPALAKMPGLTSLSLAHIPTVTDQVVNEVVAQLGATLEELYLSRCEVGDDGVAAIAASCSRLETLHLDNNQDITAAALPNLASCKTLRNISLADCNFGDDADEALAAFLNDSENCLRRISVACIGKAGDNTLLALAKHSSGSLEFVDASFCRHMTDDGLGYLADTCKRLVELQLFGCTQVTTMFLNGHSNDSLVVTGLPESCYRPPNVLPTKSESAA